MQNSKQALLEAKQWLKSQRGLSRGKLSLGTACSAFSGIVLIAQAALLAHLVDQLVFAGALWRSLVVELVCLLAIMLCRVALNRAAEHYAFSGACEIKLALRQQLYQKLTALGPHYLAGQRSAELSQLLHQGVEELEQYYARYLPAVALCAIIPLAILAVALPLDWLSGLIFLITAPLVPMFMILIGLKAEQLNQQHWQQLSRMANHFLDVLQGIAQLKLFNASRAEGEAIAQISDQYRRSTMSVLKVAFLSSLALEFLATLSVALVAITVGFRLFWGELDFATGFTLLLLAPEFYLPFRNLGAVYHDKMKGVAASVQMLPILCASSVHQGNNDLVVKNNPPHISLNNISFSYDSASARANALSTLSLEITEPGLYGVVGPSGAGKSTLADLLLGFIQPTTGDITIDGQLLSQLSLSSWRDQLAFVPQNPQLIYATLLENIRLAKPQASDEEVLGAAKLAGVDQFVDQLDNGWHHLVLEQGRSISGGQKQRIALARAFLKQAAVLILDEPSAQLDAHSELWISQALAQYSREHLVIVNAHRLHTLTQARCIFVLQNSELIDQGTTQELRARCPLFRQLSEGN